MERWTVAIRLRCRRIWVSALLRSLRYGLMPNPIRRHLIVVDQPRDRIVPASSDVSRAA